MTKPLLTRRPHGVGRGGHRIATRHKFAAGNKNRADISVDDDEERVCDAKGLGMGDVLCEEF